MIFITGCESFIGRFLIKECKKKKIKYFGIDTNAMNTKFTKKIDLRDEKLEKYIPKKAVIIHLAAISKDNLCLQNPLMAMDVNINGTLNLIHAAKRRGAEKFIFASSIWVYGEKKSSKRVNENEVIDANKINSIYILSKIVIERYLKILNLFKNVTILRFGIVYGAEHKQSWSIVEQIYDLVKNNVNKNHIDIRSKKTSRCFIHVDDLVKGIMKSVKYNSKFNIFNLSGDKLISVIDIIRITKKILNINNKTILIKQSNQFKPSIKSTCNKKIKKNLNWKPKIKLKEFLLEKYNQ
jgi:nucleoside-diphosphate-sugar epimerase